MTERTWLNENPKMDTNIDTQKIDKLIKDIKNGVAKADPATWGTVIGALVGGEGLTKINAKIFGGRLSLKTMQNWKAGTKAPNQWRQTAVVQEICRARSSGASDRAAYTLPVLKQAWTDFQEAYPDVEDRLVALGVLRPWARRWVASLPPAWTVRVLIDLLPTMEMDKMARRIEGTRPESDDVKKAYSLLVHRLDDDETEVVRSYYGIGCEIESLRKIAKKLGMSHEKVRLLRLRAMDKLLVEVESNS